MSRVNPKIDLVFKKLFGSEENKDLLLSLVNAVLYPQPQIAELSLKNPYNVSDYAEGKLSILDIKAQDEHGVWYDIEMQLKGTGFYGKRTLYYWAKMFGSQLDYLTDEEREQRSRRGYSELSKCIVISLMDFVFFPDDRYHRCYLLKDRENNETHPDLDYLDLYFVELDKFDKSLKFVQTTLERWISFLNNAHRYTRDTLPQELAEVQEIKKASAKLDIMYLDEQERIYYESQQKFWLDESSRLMEMEAKMEAAEKAAAEAKQALEKAGKEAAAAIEKAEIEAQQKRNLEIAKEALAAGLAVQVVAQITGLPPEQIENLQNETP
jgi:predicted transposase/invertase (TIGR01784 family)